MTNLQQYTLERDSMEIVGAIKSPLYFYIFLSLAKIKSNIPDIGIHDFHLVVVHMQLEC